MASPSLSYFGLLHLSSSKFQKVSSDTIKSSSFSSSTGYFVTDENDLYKYSLSSLEKTLLSTAVCQVSCNQSVLAFVTTSGFALIMGEDKEKSGILALKNCYHLRSPTKMHVLTRVSSIHLGHTHGALLTHKGEVYTWGTGLHGELGLANYEKQLPTLVHTARIFLIKQVICGKTFTAFCTAGGFVYVYGELPRSECEPVIMRQPYTIRGMCDYFIERIDCNQHFIVALTDKKEAYVADACMDVKKLDIKFSKIACSDNGIVAVAKKDKVVHEYSPLSNAFCKANGLAESVFFIDEISSNKFNLFSGFFVSCWIFSSEEPIIEINLQLLSLAKIVIDKFEEKEEGPDPKIKRIIGSTFNILNSLLVAYKKYSFFNLKLFSKCKKVALEKPIELILAPVITKFMTKSLIIKRNAWRRYESFVAASRKLYKIKVLKQSQALQSSLHKVAQKVFSTVISFFELNEFVKNQKNRFAEVIFSFVSRKKLEVKRHGLVCMKKFIQNVRTIKKKLWRVLEIAEKSTKLKFMQLLMKNHIIKMKIYKTITQIIDYSSAQSSRVRIMKLFHTWKRNLVSMKIAKISQKYARSMRTKKISEKLIQLTRKSFKLGMLSLKNFIRPNLNRFKVIFLTNSFAQILNSEVKPVFQFLKAHNIRSQKLKALFSPFISDLFFSVISSISVFIKKRRLILLLKVLTNLSTKNDNFELRCQFQAFYRFLEYNPFSLSPTQSVKTDSPKNSPILKPVPVPDKKHKILAKSRLSAGHPVPEGKPRTKATPPARNFAANSPQKRKSLLVANKGKLIPIKKQSTALNFEVNNSFNTSYSELSPKSAHCVDGSSKKFVQWEEQILILAMTMVSCLIKSYMKAYFKKIIE